MADCQQEYIEPVQSSSQSGEDVLKDLLEKAHKRTSKNLRKYRKFLKVKHGPPSEVNPDPVPDLDLSDPNYPKKRKRVAVNMLLAMSRLCFPVGETSGIIGQDRSYWTTWSMNTSVNQMAVISGKVLKKIEAKEITDEEAVILGYPSERVFREERFWFLSDVSIASDLLTELSASISRAEPE
jgi:hypothetical protein